MRAAIFDTVGRPLRIGDVPEPRPGADEVVLRVSACGICGSDLHITEDPAPFGIGAGFVLGHEFAGEIVETGTDVGDLAVGDRVAVVPMRGCGRCAACRRGDPGRCPEMTLIGGGYAEHVAVAARQCVRLPDGVDTADGALAEPLAVALHCIVRSGMKPGDRVAILGAGPIGLLVAFWARRMGAAAVVVADLHDHQCDRALALGATAFAISDGRLAERLADACGGAPDIVFECVGKRGLIAAAVGAVRLQGTVVGVGLCIGGDEWDPFVALSKEVNLLFSVFFHQGNEFAVALDALAATPFRPQALVTDTIGLGQVPQVFEGLRRRTTQCKVLIRPDLDRGDATT
ncbi:zinc-dependent alcohol dehydrogenase [Oharaeibacter diazotrophicus]|uniref:(R,R)-butanediol dehydrogenase/meso-butanediol dehydrogenase/diacetyl reductase n=1 Tax=Oharaeibacter diazotrophicus TaxID=1920512 RepID=A0A4R6RGL7_9HYPH|nr:alcohol dehydrogenase catalytic domain-containing protein [Oharaeibacter diazotrophicus]TDP85422.1 (R,R)-butanediol dehydrogenase/meso-butanediol dehydrogenase/diacetyl reductase [Oharaeibacter diazotrophicus]BBE74392.1 sorbitol dehydrogenase [Pleomorphomonas sp. SM30]GLS75912.1 Zn-dependent alcohol dehydrogenase [Oharaeibacter diazotrophicus]